MIFVDNVFCINLCILKTAQISHLIVFEAAFSLMIHSFEKWSIIWERQCFNRLCHCHEVAFIMIFLLIWIEFVIYWFWFSLLMRLNSSNCASKRFWISQICLFVFRWMSVLMNESRSNSSFSSLDWNINVTKQIDMYAVFLNVISIFLFFSCFHINMISYFSIYIWSFEILIWSFDEIRSFRNRVLSKMSDWLQFESYMTLFINEWYVIINVELANAEFAKLKCESFSFDDVLFFSSSFSFLFFLLSDKIISFSMLISTILFIEWNM
jgi:hypothetical protein